jgi:hypothetical protein
VLSGSAETARVSSAVAAVVVRNSIGDRYPSAECGRARKQADALASLVADRVGLKHEPTQGQEFLADKRRGDEAAHGSQRRAGRR